ncbi:GNAT family N-acetyltransferase [bacterium]|nr:MAG: GNAT family N-acetyltransferase [bacterium]
MPYSIHAVTCGARIALLTETEFSLRQFNTKDLESVVEINRTCLPENYASFFFMDTFQNCPSAFRVAEVGTRIVGYIMCRIEHGFSDVKRLKFVRKGHIISVAVLPEFRRAGIASELVKQALNALQDMKADECYLEVRETNETAIELYEKLGFSLARRVAHYYADGAEALVMMIPLEGE